MSFFSRVLSKYVLASDDDELFGRVWEPKPMKPISGAGLDNLMKLVRQAVRKTPVKFVDLYHTVNQDADYTAVDLEQALRNLVKQKQVQWAGDVIRGKQ